jgi:malonyl-CoA/methylmalonyl-CoA synthetase
MTQLRGIAVNTFVGLLRQSFATHRNRIALEFPQRRYRFDELEQMAERVAALFRAAGIAPGDRVLLLVESKEPFLLAYLGALWAGAVPLPLNPGFKATEVSYFATDSAATLLVHDSDTAAISRFTQKHCTALRGLISADAILNAAPQLFSAPPEPRPTDPALMLYSSGTTGEPKGVVHTQENLANAVQAIAAAWRFTPDDVLANVLPLFHIHGLSFATNVSLLTGSTMLVEDGFHPTRTLDLIDRATVFMGVPPFYYSFLKRSEFREHAARWKQLRLVTCGSAPIRAEVLPELESILGRPVINRYGMTECHVLTSLPLDGPWPHGSVGRPLDGIEVIVRTDDGRTSEPGKVGRVLARGPNLFREYWQRPEATCESFDADGWFDTGDIGQFDEYGFLTLVGRSKDLIIVGGFNVYPAVVERLINECPGVRESAVVGIPNETRGERVTAFVVADDPRLDAGKIRSFCRDRLVDYQCPTRIEIVHELPRNAMGKILKRELRERITNEGPS